MPIGALLGLLGPLMAPLLGGLFGGGEKAAPAAAPGGDLAALLPALLGKGGGGGVQAVDGKAAFGLAHTGQELTPETLALTLRGTPVRLKDDAQEALAQLARLQGEASQREFISKAGRAVVQRAAQATDPQLKAVYTMLKDRATQIQATAEHRKIVKGDERYNAVLKELLGIRSQLDQIRAAMGKARVGAGGPRYAERF